MIAILKDRAAMLRAARDFFEKRSVLEVDVPIFNVEASVDLHIDLVEAVALKRKGYLHSSPEYGMKQLLAQGIGDIYQISHVFRDGEIGERHLVEFSMVEWYRHGFSLQEMWEETCALIALFVPYGRVEVLDYEEAFVKYTGQKMPSLEKRDEVFAFAIEPHLGADGLTVITPFPKEMAALARFIKKGEKELAARFEVFYKGVELANGYEELTDPIEQRFRLEQANQERKALGKSEYPLDEKFLHALKIGIPPCAGVAVGFDRLMMLRHFAKNIQKVVCCPWQ